MIIDVTEFTLHSLSSLINLLCWHSLGMKFFTDKKRHRCILSLPYIDTFMNINQSSTFYQINNLFQNQHKPAHPFLPHPFPVPPGCHYHQRSNKSHDDTAFFWNYHCHSKLATLSDLHALREHLFSHNLTTKKYKKLVYKIMSYKLSLKCFKNCVLIHNFIF